MSELRYAFAKCVLFVVIFIAGERFDLRKVALGVWIRKYSVS